MSAIPEPVFNNPNERFPYSEIPADDSVQKSAELSSILRGATFISSEGRAYRLFSDEKEPSLGEPFGLNEFRTNRDRSEEGGPENDPLPGKSDEQPARIVLPIRENVDSGQNDRPIEETFKRLRAVEGICRLPLTRPAQIFDALSQPERGAGSRPETVSRKKPQSTEKKSIPLRHVDETAILPESKRPAVSPTNPVPPTISPSPHEEPTPVPLRQGVTFLGRPVFDRDVSDRLDSILSGNLVPVLDSTPKFFDVPSPDPATRQNGEMLRRKVAEQDDRPENTIFETELSVVGIPENEEPSEKLPTEILPAETLPDEVLLVETPPVKTPLVEASPVETPPVEAESRPEASVPEKDGAVRWIRLDFPNGFRRSGKAASYTGKSKSKRSVSGEKTGDRSEILPFEHSPERVRDGASALPEDISNENSSVAAAVSAIIRPVAPSDEKTPDAENPIDKVCVETIVVSPTSAEVPQYRTKTKVETEITSFHHENAFWATDWKPTWPAHIESMRKDASEQVRRLVDHLSLQHASGAKTVSFNGFRPGEGCTTLAICVAREFAARGFHVLLVDMHQFNPEIPQLLNVPYNPTNCEIFLLEDRLEFLPWSAAAILVETDGEIRTLTFPQLVESLRSDFDLIILDDGRLAEEPLKDRVRRWKEMNCDGVLLVVNIKHPEALDLRAIARRLREHGVSLIGVTENYVSQ